MATDLFGVVHHDARPHHWTEWVLSHRMAVGLAAAGLLGALVGVALFLPGLGLSLLVVAVFLEVGVVALGRMGRVRRDAWRHPSQRR